MSLVGNLDLDFVVPQQIFELARRQEANYCGFYLKKWIVNCGFDWLALTKKAWKRKSGLLKNLFANQPVHKPIKKKFAYIQVWNNCSIRKVSPHCTKAINIRIILTILRFFSNNKFLFDKLWEYFSCFVLLIFVFHRIISLTEHFEHSDQTVRSFVGIHCVRCFLEAVLIAGNFIFCGGSHGDGLGGFSLEQMSDWWRFTFWVYTLFILRWSKSTNYLMLAVLKMMTRNG